MKSFCLFLFFSFSIVFSGLSQYQIQTELQTFTNYGSCYLGLNDEKGKVIWPADFESLVKTWDGDYSAIPRNIYWIAEKNGSFGIIDSEGELLIPFIYSRIVPFPDGFIAADDSASYLISKQAEITWKLHDYSWIRPTSTGYIVEKNDKIGFLGLRHNELLPTSYDRIDFCTIQHQGEAIPEILSDRFLTVELNGEEGIFDLLQKKWVIEFTTDTIYPKWAITNKLETVRNEWLVFCSGSDAVFELQKSGSHDVRVINNAGKEILNGINREMIEYALTPTDSCGTKSHQMAYLEGEKKMKVVNLKTGKISNEYPFIMPLSGLSIYFEENKWGVIDTNFAELERFSYSKHIKDDLQFQREISISRAAKWKYEMLFSEYHNNEPDSVLVIREFESQRSKRENPIGFDEFFGLANFRKGKRIKADYHWITEIEFKGSSYYWAVEYKSWGEAMTEIERMVIYNSNLEIIKRFNKPTYVGPYDIRKNNLYRLISLDGKWGVVDPKGDEIIPIIYSSCRQDEVQISSTRKTKKTIFIAEDKSEKTVFDYDGNVLITDTYSSINVSGTFIRAHRENGESDLYNYKGELLLEGIKYMKQANTTDSLGICIGMENWPRIAPGVATYITKGDELYRYLNDSIQLLDEHFFQFTQKYCYFHEWALIDQKGKIITMRPTGITKISDFDRRKTPNKCSSFLDQYPVPIKETKPIKTQNYTPTPKKFIWKQGKSRNLNEWYLYNGNGQQLYQESFEYPMKEYVFTGGTFKQKGKYGYFDAQYNIQLEAEYDYIYPNAPLTLKDGLWQIHDLKTGKVSGGYEQIAIYPQKNMRYVFHQGKVGLMNDSLEWAIPLTDSVEFIKTYDLAKLTRSSAYSRANRAFNFRGLVLYGSPKEVYRQINNRHILEEEYLNSTANDLLKFSPVGYYQRDLPNAMQYLVITHKAVALRRERRPVFFNPYFYSEMTLDYGESSSTSQWDDLKDNDLFKVKAFYNYKIVGNDLVPIQLDAILKTDANSTSKLHALMIRELNKIQAYGENCTDIDAKLEELKKQFILTRKNITFYSQRAGGFKIELGYIELKELIREPNKLKPL